MSHPTFLPLEAVIEYVDHDRIGSFAEELFEEDIYTQGIISGINVLASKRSLAYTAFLNTPKSKKKLFIFREVNPEELGELTESQTLSVLRHSSERKEPIYVRGDLDITNYYGLDICDASFDKFGS